jgi:hypothetical protein
MAEISAKDVAALRKQTGGEQVAEAAAPETTAVAAPDTTTATTSDVTGDTAPDEEPVSGALEDVVTPNADGNG